MRARTNAVGGWRRKPTQDVAPARHRVVDSTNVAQVAWWYDQGRRLPILAVTFTPKRGSRPRHRTWHYLGVPRGVYESMVRAASRGRFVWRELYPEYVGYEVGGG